MDFVLFVCFSLGYKLHYLRYQYLSSSAAWSLNSRDNQGNKDSVLSTLENYFLIFNVYFHAFHWKRIPYSLYDISAVKIEYPFGINVSTERHITKINGIIASKQFSACVLRTLLFLLMFHTLGIFLGNVILITVWFFSDLCIQKHLLTWFCTQFFFPPRCCRKFWSGTVSLKCKMALHKTTSLKEAHG